MKTVAEIRYENLERLALEASGASKDLGAGLSKLVADAKARGRSLSRPTLYQILTKRHTGKGAIRNVGDDVARNIEDALKLERGWMDHDHSETSAIAPIPVLADEIADVVAVFCQADEIGRDGIKSAVTAARRRLSMQPPPSDNQPEDRGDLGRGKAK